MSKKAKRAPRDEAAAIVHARTLREQRWVYEQRRRRLRWDQIAALAAEPAPDGLGVARSAKQLKAAYEVHVAEVIELEAATRPEATTMMLGTLDDAHRALSAMASLVDEARTELKRRQLRAEGATDEEVEAAVVLRPDSERRDAIAKLAAIERDRAKLLGLDAPIAVDVTTHDATLDETRDALARLGIKPPIKVKP